MAAQSPPPPGFHLLESVGSYVRQAGNFYLRETPEEVTVGTWIEERHANLDGVAHGGFLLTLADFALSFTTKAITINLSADFMRPARVGDWVEAAVTVRKRSSSLLFADTLLRASGVELLRATGVLRPVRSTT